MDLQISLGFASLKRLFSDSLRGTSPSWKSWRLPKIHHVKIHNFSSCFRKKGPFHKEKRGDNRLQVPSFFEEWAVSFLGECKWTNEYDRIIGIMTLLKAASFFRSDVTSFLAQTNSFEFHYSKALPFFHHCITKNIKHHHNIKIKKNKSQKHLQGHQKNACDLNDSILLQIPEHWIRKWYSSHPELISFIHQYKRSIN